MKSSVFIRVHLWLIFFFSIAGILSAQTIPPSYKALKYPPLPEIKIPKVEESTLPNGMKIYLLENHHAPRTRRKVTDT